MLKQLLSFFRVRPKEIKNGIGGYEIHINGIGFYDIKIGDKFEGAACGHFFSNQKCESVNGEYVIGTTTLVTFRKCNIRPITENAQSPYLETYGSMKEHEQELNKATGVI